MTTVLPLTLEMSQPMLLSADLETLLAHERGVDNAMYDPTTQIGVYARGHNRTSSRCVNFGLIQIDDVLQDLL